MFSRTQWGYIKYWLVIVVISESAMFVFNQHLPLIYMSISCLFLGGFVLRVFKMYPGKDEPLILDASAVFISLVFAYTARVMTFSAARFVLIFFSSLTIMPHIGYIIKVIK